MTFDELDRLVGEPKRARSPKPIKPERRSVLVVDDDPHVLKVLRRVLSFFYEVTAVTSALDALAAISPSHSVVILDIRMPIHDGFWACDRIRERFPDVPVIFHTAHQSEKVPEDLFAAHRPFAYLHKDGDLDRLLSTVAAAMESTGAGS